TGFMGFGMAANAMGGGGFNAAQQLYGMGAQQQAQQPQQAPQQAANGWKCACGATATGNFCPECGAKKPENDGWKCACGAVNTGKFCQNCGAKKPASACEKCGYKFPEGEPLPKFCPECGDKV
ncbi:MAG: SPFH domain-containing protein, partial [Clostridia bacterium]|nr:SPFH domain-containing protein [Clostridia bacterium]